MDSTIIAALIGVSGAFLLNAGALLIFSGRISARVESIEKGHAELSIRHDNTRDRVLTLEGKIS